jgi:alpha-tubulin suppressor-like RCC1 family protein
MGSPLLLSVVANGVLPVHCQWRRNGVDVPGLTGLTLALASFQAADSGVYSVVLSNAFGVSESPGAILAASPVAVWGTGPVTNLPVALSNAVAVAAGEGHALALKADGTVVAWGSSNTVRYTTPPGAYVTNAHGQLDVPAGLTGVVAVAAGAYHNLALRRDGTIVSWGLNDAGQASVPAFATNAIAVAAGAAHSMALRADGSVVVWGTNQGGLTTVPASAANVVAIAAGATHALALRADGVAVAWGAAASGATLVPSNAADLVAIAAGLDYSLGLRRDGIRVQWGRSMPTVVRPGSSFTQSASFPDDNTYLAAGAGRDHVVYLLADGSPLVYSKATPGFPAPQEAAPAWFRQGVAVAAGAQFSVGLIRPPGGIPSLQPELRRVYEGGTAVFAAFGPGQRVADCQWEVEGAELAGATGPFLVRSNTPAGAAGTYTVRVQDRAGTVRSGPARLEVLTPPPPQIVRQPSSVEVGAGSDTFFNVATGAGVPAFFAWQFNGAELPGATRPVLFLPGVQSANAGTYQVRVRNAGGWVDSAPATLTVTSTPPVIVVQPTDAAAVRGNTVQLAVRATGTAPLAYQWELEEVPRAGADGATLVLSEVQPADAGGYRVIVTNAFGAATSAVAQVYLPPLSVWGDRRTLPGGPSVAASNLIAVALGGGHGLGLRQDGLVVAWGTNGCGQATVPAGVSNVVQVAAGELHSLALRSDGTVKGWGSSYFGGAVPESSLSNIVQVSAGSAFSLALDAEGRIYSWDKPENFKLEPAAGAVAVAAGGLHRLALLRDGRVTAWGPNPLGQTGVPAEATNAVAIAAGLGFSGALRADGLVVAWGTFEASPAFDVALYCSGYHMQYGNGSVYRPLPVPAEATNVVAIAAGRHHLVALRADGRVIAWGENFAGQCDVPELDGVAGVAAGGDLSVALHAALGARFGAVDPIRVVGENAGVVLNLGRAGRAPFAQRWQFDGVELTGATGAALWLAPGQVRAGEYRAEVTNVYGGGSAAFSLVVTQAPPVVRIEPTFQWVEEGNDAVFRAVAAGSAQLEYRWRRDGADLDDGAGIEGSRRAVLTLRAVAAAQAGAYGAVVTNPLGSATSLDATLVVLTAPPLAAALDTTGLVWTAGGDAGWRWQADRTHDGIDAAASGPFTTPQTNRVETTVSGPAVVAFWWTTSGWYNDRLSCLVDGLELAAIGNDVAWERRTVAVPAGAHTVGWVHVGKPFSRESVAVLDQVALVDPEAPTVTTQPAPRAVVEGAPATFSVVAAGTAPLLYQWRMNGAAVLEATNASLTLPAVRPAGAGDYTVVVMNLAGSVTSQVATLTLMPSAPLFASAPQPVVTAPGLTARFEAAVRGTTPLQVQWQFNRADLAGPQGAFLELPDVSQADIGWYRLIARNELGTSISAEVALALVPVAAWGSNAYGQTRVPADVGDAVEVAAGYYSSLVRRRDGSLGCWGGYAVPPYLFDEAIPAGRFVRVVSRGEHHLGLRADGSLAAWGQTEPGLAAVPVDVGRVVAIGAGAVHNLALRADGTVAAWGSNAEGQCSVPSEASNLVAVAGGHAHSLGLRWDGTVVAWGANDAGQCAVPTGLTEVIGIDAGDRYSLALRADGTVAVWGNLEPSPGLAGVLAIAAGPRNAYALRANGTVVQWGDGLPAVPAGLRNAISVAGGRDHALAVVGDGRPAITVLPFWRAAVSGGWLRLHVRAAGAAPLEYQWRRDGVDLPGATGPTLEALGTAAELAGTYTVRVANALGAVESAPSSVAGPEPVLVFETAPGSIRLEADGLHLVLRGLSGRGPVRIWTSADLASWKVAGTHPAAVGRIEWVDPAPFSAGLRFYRATEGE